VGVQLLIRHARGIQLTAASRAFLDHARIALAQAEAAMEAARRAAHPAKPSSARDRYEVLIGELARIDFREQRKTMVARQNDD
jgi:hypothetical protein